MNRIVDGLITSFALILFVPTILVLISWNAIPGDSLYGLKSGLENTTLVLLAGTPLVPQLSMKYTDRRLSEATVLLDKKGSTVGYQLLVAEAVQTQNYIADKNDTVTAAKFSANIEEYKQQIQEKKAEIRAQNNLPPETPTAIPTANPVPTSYGQTPTPTPFPTTPVSTVTPTVTETTVVVEVPQAVVIRQENPEEVLAQLEETEAQLNQIQEQVNEEASHPSFKEAGDKDTKWNDEKDDKKDNDSDIPKRGNK
jgi:hypothetical protein